MRAFTKCKLQHRNIQHENKQLKATGGKGKSSEYFLKSVRSIFLNSVSAKKLTNSTNFINAKICDCLFFVCVNFLLFSEASVDWVALLPAQHL